MVAAGYFPAMLVDRRLLERSLVAVSAEERPAWRRSPDSRGDLDPDVRVGLRVTVDRNSRR